MIRNLAIASTATRHAEAVDTSTSHLGFRYVIGNREAAP
jgi:hypothetical protein